MKNFLLTLLLILAAPAIALDRPKPEHLDMVQSKIDSFVECVLDDVAQRIDSDRAASDLAETAVESCAKQLASLRSAIATMYLSVNPDGPIDAQADADTERYRDQVIEATINHVHDKRSVAGGA